jgi:hypothetical protein
VQALDKIQAALARPHAQGETASGLAWLMTPSASVLAASPMRALSWLTVQAARPCACRKGSAARPAASLPTPASLNTLSQGRAASA